MPEMRAGEFFFTYVAALGLTQHFAKTFYTEYRYVFVGLETTNRYYRINCLYIMLHTS